MINGYQWIINSNKHEEAFAMLEACGLIPNFIDGLIDETNAQTVLYYMIKRYGFGENTIEGGHIDDEGRFCYPEDPDMDWYIKTHLENGITVRVYGYGVVAVTDDTQTLVVRMD